MKRPQQVSSLLETLFADKPLAKRMGEAKIWLVWEEAVGRQIASKAMPVSFRDGKLTVRVTSSPWMQQLSMMKEDIIGHLNGAIGEQKVTDIHFKQGTIGSAIEVPVPQKPVKRGLTDEELARLKSLTGSVDDSELRDAIVSLISSQLSSRQLPPNP